MNYLLNATVRGLLPVAPVNLHKDGVYQCLFPSPRAATFR